jgi:holliday junction DNA helicase RuvA
MIYQLKGKIDDISKNFLVVDVNGVGYGVSVPARLSDRSVVGQDIKLNTVTVVSQDNIQLFGFPTTLDRQFFLMLINIPRIGPKGALKILSETSAPVIIQSILSGDGKNLSKLPGVGAKAADRMIIELKEKVSSLLDNEDGEYENSFEETVDVLIGLGCSPAEARETLAKVNSEKAAGELTFDELINEALRIMSEEELNK